MRFLVLSLAACTITAAPLAAQQRLYEPSAVLSLPADAARMIASGETKRGELRATDDFLSDSSHFGRWYFSGRRGERVTVTQRSGSFDTYLFLGKQGAAEIAEQNDDAEETNSEIAYTLPDDGVYVIIAGSFEAQATGEYSISLTIREPLPGMTGPITPVTVLLREPDPMQRVGLDRRMGSQLDARDGKMDDGTHFELWYFSANAGDQISIALESSQFAGTLFVGPQGGQQTEGGAIGRRPQVDFTAPQSGTYVIVVKGNTAADLGSYMLELLRKTRTP